MKTTCYLSFCDILKNSLLVLYLRGGGVSPLFLEAIVQRKKRWVQSRVFDEISFRENFAKLATKRFSCFAKMRDEFREFRSFAKLPIFTKETSFAKLKNRENGENLK